MHHGLVADDAHHATTGVQITALGEGDQALGQRTKALGLRQRGGDAAVLEQAGRHVCQHEALVCGAGSQTRALLGCRHWVYSLYVRSSGKQVGICPNIRLPSERTIGQRGRSLVFRREERATFEIIGIEGHRRGLEAQAQGLQLLLDLID